MVIPYQNQKYRRGNDENFKMVGPLSGRSYIGDLPDLDYSGDVFSDYHAVCVSQPAALAGRVLPLLLRHVGHAGNRVLHPEQ